MTCVTFVMCKMWCFVIEMKETKGKKRDTFSYSYLLALSREDETRIILISHTFKDETSLRSWYCREHWHD